MEMPNPSHLRKYIHEYALIGLTSAVIALFLIVNDLNKYIRVTLTEQIILSREAVKEAKETTSLILQNQKSNGNSN